MTITELELPGVFLIQPKVWPDSRGFFLETYHRDAFFEKGITADFIQDNLSFSRKGVIRGLHFQKLPHAQDKLVRCVQGSVFDVAADVDAASPTFGEYVHATLSGENHAMLFIPGKYAHGFCATADAIVEYKVSAYYAPEYVGGVRYDDPTLAISWPVAEPIVSAQDAKWPPIASHRS